VTSSTRSTASRLAACLGAAALAVALAACGSSAGGHDMGSMGGADGASRSASPSTSTSPSSSAATTAGDHNDADVTFAQDMVVHHEGAIAMAELATDRAGDQRVKDLAARIRAAQGPEVQQMTGWLQAWGEPSSGSTGSTEGMDHSQHGGAMGMMTEEQTAQLSAATGTTFDRMFLEMMVVHHQGAVEMAQQERTAGVSPEATALAGSVVTSQTAEIAEMQQLLKSLG
jgi:uncharacterized protein (DUF305 family)